jgi:DNA-binding PadR family transcriptional regulator
MGWRRSAVEQHSVLMQHGKTRRSYSATESGEYARDELAFILHSTKVDPMKVAMEKREILRTVKVRRNLEHRFAEVAARATVARALGAQVPARSSYPQQTRTSSPANTP